MDISKPGNKHECKYCGGIINNRVKKDFIWQECMKCGAMGSLQSVIKKESK